jgi:general secretion pathway protein L
MGTHAVKAVEIRQTLRSFELVTACRFPRPDPETPASDLARSLMIEHQLSTEHVVSALRGDRVSMRRLSLPFSDAKKISAAIPFEVEEDLPFDLEDCLIDWESVRSGRSGSDVIAIVAPRSEVSQAVEMLQAAGCSPHTLEAEGLVLGNLAALFDLPGARLVIDLGHTKSTCCALLEGRAVAARTIPVGGCLLTEAIAQDRGLSEADAERVKCEERILGGPAQSGMPRTLGVIDRLAREILRTASSVDERLAAIGGGPIEGITLVGGGALLSGIESALSERTSIPAVPLGLPTSDSNEASIAIDSPALYAPALALALRGTAQARTRTNFLQDEFAVRIDFGRYRKDFGTTAVLASVALLLACVGFATSTFLDLRRADRVEAAIDQIYSATFPDTPVPENAIAAFRKALSDANQRADFLGVYPGNLSALDVLSQISKHLPKDLDVVFEELNISRQTIRMRVFAKKFESADRLGAELAKYAPFVRTQIGAIENDPKRNGKRFTVTITLTSPEGAA